MVRQFAQPLVGLDAAIFADPQEDDTIDQFLNGEIGVARPEIGIAEGDIARQQLPPGFDFPQKGIVHLRRPAFAARDLNVLVKVALIDGFLGEHARNLRPSAEVFGKWKVENARCGGRVVLVRLDTAIVDREFPEIGQYAEGQLGRPRVPAKLKCGVGFLLHVDRRPLGLDEELASATDSETVVRRLGGAPDLDRIFVNDVLVRLGRAGLVVDVPPKSFEEGVEKLSAKASFVVYLGPVSVQIPLKSFNEAGNLRGDVGLPHTQIMRIPSGGTHGPNAVGRSAAAPERAFRRLAAAGALQRPSGAGAGARAGAAGLSRRRPPRPTASTCRPTPGLRSD